MVNNFTPSYLSSIVPQPVNAASAYNFRNQNNIQSIATRTNYYFNSFLPSTIREWNSIPLDTRNSGSIETFKRKLNHDVTPLCAKILFYRKQKITGFTFAS